MAPRRRPRAGAAAPAPPTLASLPDDLLLRCLQLLSQEERLRSVALVNKRFQQLCLAPQLLRSLTVRISGPSVLPRTAALLQFLTAHATHVQELELDVHPAADGSAPLSDSQQQELAANAAGALVACAAGALQCLTMRCIELAPLMSLAWLPALRQLQHLELGSPAGTLRLPAATSRLTALAAAGLAGGPLVLEGPLPLSLTQLHIYDATSAELPRQVSQLSALATLHLNSVHYQAASMACLSTVTTLRRLDVINATALPPSLPAMTWLECLSIGPADSTSAAEQAAWQQTEAAALSQLTRLTTLLIDVASELESDLAAIAQLPRLQRLSLPRDLLPSPAALGGPWLASLRWLGLPWWLLERAVQALRAAPRLEYVCSLTMPTRFEEEPWRAAWDFLATHPPLRCFGIDSSQPSDLPVFDAAIGLKNRRPGLLVRRIQDGPTTGFEVEVLHEVDVPLLLP